MSKKAKNGLKDKVSISNFLYTDYKTYSMYVIENRAIPSVIDSFKVVQRKIMHISNKTWKTGQEKPLKVFQLSGRIADMTYYHHGSQSMENAIINVAQKFKNNLPLLEEHGIFGSLRSPNAGAPRYIGTRLHENFRKVYKDFELLEYNEEEGNIVEPKFFLPIIPMVIVNGSSGIAVGFASNILNRNPKDIIRYCENILNGKQNRKKLIPYSPYFDGTYDRDENNHKRWIIRGIFERVNTTTIKVSELPPSMSYEKYDDILDDLYDKKLITNYDNNSTGGTIEYIIKFTRSSLSGLTDEKLYKFLKLEEYVTENFNVLNENQNLISFETAEDICEYFVEFRLKYYNKRKENTVAKLKREENILSNKAKFIKAVIEDVIIINNKKKDDIIKGITKLKLDKVDDSYDYLLRMPIYSLTKEMYDKLKEDIKTKKTEIKKILETKPSDMYLEDLRELDKFLK